MPTASEFVFLQEIQRLDWKPGVTKHNQTYSAFLSAARAGLAPSRALELIMVRLRTMGAVLNERDILRQRTRAYEFITNQRDDAAGLPAGLIFGKNSGFHFARRLPSFSHTKLKALTKRIGFTVDADWLKSRSPLWPNTWWEYLAAIYQPEDRILIFSKFNSRNCCVVWPTVDRMSAAPSSEEGAWYLCNPVDGQWRSVSRCRSDSNPEGLTCRSEECITSFRYMVLESDHKDEDYPGVQQDWLRFMILLPLRIVSLYTSAGKSIHALVRLDAASKEDWDNQVREMKPFLVEHGADKGALRAVQLTRLPYAYRGGRRQELLYCNPAADGTPICELPISNEGGQVV